MKADELLLNNGGKHAALSAMQPFKRKTPMCRTDINTRLHLSLKEVKIKEELQ